MKKHMSKLGLSDLLESDLSSNEYFQTLSQKIQQKLKQEDVASFDEMQTIVERMQNK